MQLLRSHRRAFLSLPLIAAFLTPSLTPSLFGQTAQNPPADNIRPIPPPGITVPDADKTELTAGAASLGKEIETLQTELRTKPELLRYLPDVQIFHNAVRYALTYNEFYKPQEFAAAKALLEKGRERAAELRRGRTPWLYEKGLVVLGYKSRIDDSIQPYGLVVPETWDARAGATAAKKHRLDFFCHGRGEQLTELAFLTERQRNPGEFTPPDAFVLHPYGRYCNANRFAGEVDLFEALADLKTRYPIDDNRIVARGFSMGGAACWQFATHHADKWAAAAPGAGFSETAEFLRLFAPGKPPVPQYEQTLFRWYDPTEYAANLAMLPTVAYNGDMDGQKQAADRMEDAMRTEGLTLPRIIGPNTGHKYHPDSKKEINAFVDAAVAKGRDTLPDKIRFTTFTLRYNTMHWITVTGLAKHWERARVNAERTPDTITISTHNVTRFTIDPRAARKTVLVDGQKLSGTAFVREGGSDRGLWTVDKAPNRIEFRKRPGLQGPIDDAFMERFVMVTPTRKPISPSVGTWVEAERTRAIREWRAALRGEALVKNDTEISDDDIRNANLILWGDPSSNAILARLAARLPIRWEKDGTIRVGAKTYRAGDHVPVLIYPNPLNPNRYVVLNSGITWREAAYLNNAQQRPRLPDWAIVDITTPPDKNAPGRIVDAGFFRENWGL